MKLSEIFIKTKDILWDGITPYTSWPAKNTSPYICDNIEDVKDISDKDIERAKGAIASSLSHSFSLLFWLYENQHITQYEYEALASINSITQINHPGLVAKLQATRFAWLDHLASYYKSIGD